MTQFNLSPANPLKRLFVALCHCVTRACIIPSRGLGGDTPCQNDRNDTNNNINDLYIIVSPYRGYCVTSPARGGASA